MINTAESVIAVRSRRQALDWSLVLASQGIEAVITPPTEVSGWQLVVSAGDHSRALDALRLYRDENRRHVWVQRVPGTDLVFDGSSLVWLVLITMIYWLDHEQSGHLRAAGIVDSQAVRAGEWWRLFTAIMLHGDLAHLAANLTTGFLLLGLAMGTLGPGLGMLGAYLAGVGGNLAGLWLYAEPHRGLGASGMVLGALGLLTAQSLVFWRAGVSGKQLIVRGVFGGLLLLVLLGMNPNPTSDVVAHVTGFLGGLVLAAGMLSLPERWRRNRWLQRLASLVCTGAVILTWGLALQ